MKDKIVTFGEILLRLTPPGYLKVSQSRTLCATFGGSETNAAVSLAHMGMNSEFVTRLPENEIAEACMMDLRSHGVKTDNIVYGGERLGLYYFENTASFRHAKISYDRNNSSFCTVEPGMIDWQKIFADACWYHWSGIGPSLSQSAADTTTESIEVAEKMGLTISCDLNFRKNLWKYGKDVREVMTPMVERCQILFGTEAEFEKTFDIKSVGYKAKSENDEIDVAKYEEFCSKVMKKAPKCEKMFIALRNELDAKRHILTGILYTNEGKLYKAHTYAIDNIVDCMGVGDAFAAGLIYGIINYPNDNQMALDYSVAASTLKNTITGDYNIVGAADVLALVKSGGSGQISR